MISDTVLGARFNSGVRPLPYAGVHRPVLQPAAAAGEARVLITGCLHATVHAAAKGGVSVGMASVFDDPPQPTG
jgi:hypothetical protein